MPNPLTRQQQTEICTALHIGCDRETAAKYARTTWAEVHATMQADPAFAARLRHEESLVEITHMQQLREASKKEANWRISVWWLERLYPERYGPRGAGTINSRELKKFIEHMAAVLVDEVQHKEDRERLVRRLEWMAHTLELFLRDEFPLDDPGEDCDTRENIDTDEVTLGDSFASPNGAPHHDEEE